MSDSNPKVITARITAAGARSCDATPAPKHEAPYTKRVAALLTAPALLEDARNVLARFERLGGSVAASFLGSSPHRTAWRIDVFHALCKAARAPKRHFGSFDVTKCLTWASTLGFTPEAVAALLLINANELVP